VGDTDSRRQLLRILAGRSGKAGSRITDLPPQFRILLTSRPLLDIHTALRDISYIRHQSMDSIPRDSTERDLYHYISTQLSNTDVGIEGQEMFAALAQASCGLFEWARLACAYVAGDGDAALGLSAHERFDAIISRTKYMSSSSGTFSCLLVINTRTFHYWTTCTYSLCKPCFGNSASGISGSSDSNR